MARILGFHNNQTKAWIKDIKPNQTEGGTFTSGAYQVRTLNTLENPQSVTWVSLNANQFTLQPGVYKIKASVPAHNVNRHKAKLRNISDASDALIGTSQQNTTTSPTTTDSIIIGTLTITSPKVYEIQHRCQTTGTTNGFGSASNWVGENEVYTVVEIEKVA